MSIFDDVLVGVPSWRRPYNVARMQEHYDDILWCLADEKDAKDYRSEGARNIVISPAKGTCPQRNHLCNIAELYNQFSCHVDDDLINLHEWHGPRHHQKTPMTLEKAIEDIFYAMQSADTRYGGALYTENPFSGASRVHTHAFLQASLTVVNPLDGMRWCEDKVVESKDEWEMTARNIVQHGAVARVDWILPLFKMGEDPYSRPNVKNRGGLEKTYETEMAGVREVIDRYPDLIEMSNVPLRLKMIHNIKTMDKKYRKIYDKVNKEVKQRA